MESSKPTLAAVLNELVPIEDKWQDIGIQLNLKDEILLEIERKPTNTRSQLREMIRHWLDTSKASWTDLVSALSTRLVSEETIAGVLSSTYCYEPLNTDGGESRKDSLEREPHLNGNHRSESTTKSIVVRVKGRNVPREVISRFEKTVPECDGTELSLGNYEVDKGHTHKSHCHSISSASELLKSEVGKSLRRKSLSDVKSARRHLNGHSEPVVIDSRSKHTPEGNPDLQDRIRGSYSEGTTETPNSRLKSRQTRVVEHTPRDYTKQLVSSTDKRKSQFLPEKEKHTPRRPDKDMATVSRFNNSSSPNRSSKRSIDVKNMTDRSIKAPELSKDAHILNRNGIAAAICDTVKTTLNENKYDKQKILKVESDAPKKRASLNSIESPCEKTATKPVRRFDEAVKSLMKSSSLKHSKSVERNVKVSDTDSTSENNKISHCHSTHSERSTSSSHYPTKKTSDTKMKVKSKEGSDLEIASKYKHSTKSPVERERKSRSSKVVKIEVTSDGSPSQKIKKSSHHHSSDSELAKCKSKHTKNKSEKSAERKRKSEEESGSETVSKKSKHPHLTKSPLQNESDSLPSKVIKIEVSSDIEVSTRRKIKKSLHKYSSDSDSTKKQSEKHAVKKKKLEAEKEAEPESTSKKSRHSKTLPVSTPSNKMIKLEVASDTDSLPKKSTKPHSLSTTALPLSLTKRIKTEVLSDLENEYTPENEVYRISVPVANVIKPNAKVSNYEHNTDSVVKHMADSRTPQERYASSTVMPAQTTTTLLPHFQQVRPLIPHINSFPMTGPTAPIVPYVPVGRVPSYYQPLLPIPAKIPSLMDISFPSVSETTPYKHSRQQAAVPDALHPKPSNISVPSFVDISSESSVGKATPGKHDRLGAPDPNTFQPTPSKVRKVSSGTKSSEKPPNSPKPNADEFNVPSTFGDEDCAKRQFIARKCVKCKRLPRKPKRSRCCLLLYCEPCSMDTKYQLCSVCRRKQVFKLDSELNNKIPKLTVFCKHNSGGCNWKGKLYKLKNHLLHECEVPCPYSSFGCQATVTNDNYKSHIEKLALVHLELYKKSRNEPADS